MDRTWGRLQQSAANRCLETVVARSAVAMAQRLLVPSVLLGTGASAVLPQVGVCANMRRGTFFMCLLGELYIPW